MAERTVGKSGSRMGTEQLSTDEQEWVRRARARLDHLDFNWDVTIYVDDLLSILERLTETGPDDWRRTAKPGKSTP